MSHPVLAPRSLRALVARASLLTACALTALTGACRASGEERAAAGTPAAKSAPAPAGATAAGEAPGPVALGADSTALRAAADSGRVVGAPGAKVWVLMVSDFQCPYCKQWHDQSFEALHREYVASGKVRMAYLNYPLDQHVQAVPAAEAAMCAAAQHKFWEYQTALFTTVERWGGAGDKSGTFDSLATAQGVDLGRFQSCTRSHVMRALIDADRDRMSRAGVQSTPTFFIGDQGIAGAQPTDVFRRAIDTALARTAAR